MILSYFHGLDSPTIDAVCMAVSIVEFRFALTLE